MAIRKDRKNENYEADKFIKVEYNPYIYELKIKDSSFKFDDNSRTILTIKKNKERALHLWYKELIEAISQDLYTKSFNIIFCGRNEEYLDISEEIEYLNLKQGWNLSSKLELKEGNANIVEELENYVEDIKENAPEELMNEIKRRNAIKEFENAKNSEAEVSVIATMSSGKSTLLNAILGKEILPSKNEACTATICRIKDVPGKKIFMMRAEDIDGKVLCDWKEAIPQDISSLNDAGNEKGINIYLEGDIPGIDSKDMSLILIDTPGPNNSQTQEHKEATYRFIKDTTNNPLVLYVMNATQHGTNDDATLLREISEIIKEHGKQAEERFIFALNKIDCFDPEKESIETLIKNSKRYLEQFGIKNPKIFPVSAEAAKLVRMKQTRATLSRAQNGNLNNYEYSFLPDENEGYEGIDTIKYASIPENIKEKLYLEAKCDNVKAMLNYSGITAIEIYIERYVNKYAKTQKVRDSIKTLKDVVDNAYNQTKLVHDKTSEELEVIIKQIEEIEIVLKTRGKAKLEEVRERIKNLKPDTSKYQKAFSEVERIFRDIEVKFNDSKVTKDKAEIIIEESKNKIEKLNMSIKTSLEQAGVEELSKAAQSIIDELKEYFQDILGSINLQSDVKQTLESSFNLELPNTRYLVSEAAYEAREYVGQRYVKTVSRSTWWKPWTWGDEEDIYEDVYETKTYVNLNNIHVSHIEPVQVDFREKINIAQNKLFEEVKELKIRAEENLKAVEENINEKLRELKEKAQSQQVLQSEKQQLNTKMDKIVEYKRKLDLILEK